MPATVEHLKALRADRGAFGELLGSDVPDGWPEFPEAIDFTIGQLTRHPHQVDWWLHFFLAESGSRLVGSGGFVGPPQGGIVEIGYEIAPEFRGRGFGTAAARAMIGKAVASSSRVSTVVAHTRPERNASTNVLRRLGFRQAGDVEDPDEGTVWRWELPVASATAW